MKQAPKAPKPSAQELALQQSQADTLNQQRALLQQQLGQQNLLAPHIYESMGLRPRYAMEPDPNNPGQMRVRGDNITGAPVVEGFDRFDTPEMLAQRQAMDNQNALAESQLQQLKTGNLLQVEALKQAGYNPTLDDSGNITGLSLDPNSTAAIQDATNRMLLERQQKALRGELDVDPGLTREFDRSEAALRSQLQKNLGAGYDTSTPGIQALAEFNQRKGDSLAAARRGEIGYAGQLALAGQNQANANNYNAQGSGQFLQNAMRYQNPFGGPGQGAMNAQNYLMAAQAPYQGAGGLGTLSQLYGNAQDPMFRNRAFDYRGQMNRYNNSFYKTAVAPFYNSFATSLGSSLGEAGGSAAKAGFM